MSIDKHVFLFILSPHVCVWGNRTLGVPPGITCSGDSGGPLVVIENQRGVKCRTDNLNIEILSFSEAPS